MRKNILPALLLLLLGAALAEWFSTDEAHAQALPPSGGGSDACTGQACSVASLTSSGAISGTTGAFSDTVTSTVASGSNALILQPGAKIRYNATQACQNLSGYFWCDGAGFYGSEVQAGSFRGTGTNQFFAFGSVTDGASAMQHRFGGTTTMSTAGSLVMQWDNPTNTAKMQLTHFGGLRLVGMTTAARDALAGADLRAGTIVYNTSTNKLNLYSGTAWETVTSL